ncbi:MAG: GrpB family protein [Deinococcota bacterium]
MDKQDSQLIHSVEVVDYDPKWIELFSTEREGLLASTGNHFVELEHIGSTAIPNQRAKPIIDMMAAIYSLDELDDFLPALVSLNYQLIDAGMSNRYFLRKLDKSTGQTFHLHIVELSTWAERQERLMRDYLLKHPAEVQAYGVLKTQLATQYQEDSVAYTKAKTKFIQNIIDKAHDELGLPRVSVWEE